MLGAIIGDMLGNGYDFTGDIPTYEEVKEKYNKLFKQENIKVDLNKEYLFTDDTVMSIAVADSIADSFGKTSDEIKASLVKNMQKYGRKYINVGYGMMFKNWILSENPILYNSYGNGSAMRVSSVGWMANNLNEVDIYSRLTAEITHNSKEGIKGAQAIASAIFLARNNTDKSIIKKYIEREYGYNLSNTIDYYKNIDIQKRDALCETAVMQAFAAFFESEDFEDAVIKAVTIGGDTDTIAAISGSIAEAYYGIDEKSKELAISYLTEDLKQGINNYLYILMYRRNERKKVYDSIFTEIDYFKNKIKKDNGRKIPLFMMNQFDMSNEIEKLINIVNLPEIVDKGYIDTLDLYSIEMDSDIYIEKAKQSSPYLLRAMITSIVKQEIFSPGTVNRAIEEGAIYEILINLKEKNSYK